ncbi:MAG TPA: heme ABC transporter ATP-binding protein [Candidatus Corynebacterium avicola]|uniref:Heme ABC transporter ATP-binding protein n=1 Tax=Candidatus Corynebacterium avicola TaxID=2838527 RepID=A0A9D1RU89_9CORY|nr:heme ABC transporter ATP-binding protein [Candidatus Corynebacterium avicola]
MSTATTSSVVTAEGVAYRVGRSVLVEDVSFTLQPGTLTALVGPNGAGKSTMLALLAGDYDPSEGTVLIGDTAPKDWDAPELATQRSVMLQQHSAHFGFSVAETVAMGRLPHDIDRENDKRIVEESIEESELSDLRRRDVTTLSGGESARVAYARTAAQSTPVILLDEPTAALDLRHQEVLLRSAARRRDEGAAVIVVLHDLNLAARYADRVMVFSDGHLVADGPPGEVLTPQRIREVYGQRVHLMHHPETGAPVIVPVHDTDKPVNGKEAE